MANIHEAYESLDNLCQWYVYRCSQGDIKDDYKRMDWAVRVVREIAFMQTYLIDAMGEIKQVSKVLDASRKLNSFIGWWNQAESQGAISDPLKKTEFVLAATRRLLQIQPDIMEAMIEINGGVGPKIELPKAIRLDEDIRSA